MIATLLTKTGPFLREHAARKIEAALEQAKSLLECPCPMPALFFFGECAKCARRSLLTLGNVTLGKRREFAGGVALCPPCLWVITVRTRMRRVGVAA